VVAGGEDVNAAAQQPEGELRGDAGAVGGFSLLAMTKSTARSSRKPNTSPTKRMFTCAPYPERRSLASGVSPGY
jgi:hypothetical protein